MWDYPAVNLWGCRGWGCRSVGTTPCACACACACVAFRVAIKCISKLNFSSDKDTANMKLETALMLRVRGHPNVVRAAIMLVTPAASTHSWHTLATTGTPCHGRVLHDVAGVAGVWRLWCFRFVVVGAVIAILCPGGVEGVL